MSKPLNPQEIWTLQQLADGKGTKAQANAADLSAHTVRDRRKSLFQKLGVHTAAHAVAEGFRKGLIK